MSPATAFLESAPAAPAPAAPSARRALLFFLAPQDAYRRPLFSAEEIFCGPDATPRKLWGRTLALKTPEGSYDVRDVLGKLGSEQQPEFLVVKADATGRGLPRNLSALKGPKVLLVGDTHHLTRPIQSLIRYAQEEPFDFIIFDHTRHHARFFAEAGLRNLHWLPALDYGFEHRELKAAPSRPLTFVGQAGRFHPYRRWVLDQVRAAGLPLEMLRGRLAETADFYSDSQITLNVSLNGDLNLRVFEALAAGGFLLTDALPDESGLGRLFQAGKHLDTWRTPGELIEKIRHYRAHPEEAKRIRQEGQAELLRSHRPEVKLKEFYALLDGGEPPARYDLRAEPWWPRGASVAMPGWARRIAAYEAVQELHRVSARVTVYAQDPAVLAGWANLPRLEIRPLEQMPAGSAPDATERSALWLEETTPEEALGRFPGETLFAATEKAAARPEIDAWGYEPEAEGSPVLRLVHPERTLERAWGLGLRPAVHARLGGLIEAATDSVWCVALANYARMVEDRRLQFAALKRAVGVDRNNTTALLSLAALMIDEGDAASVTVLLEEAARIEELPAEVEAVRRELAARPGMAAGLGFYLRAIGRAPEEKAERPRRVLVVTNLFPPQELGGYGRQMWEFAHGLRRRGHEVLVLTSDQPGLAKAPRPEEAALESCVRRVLPLLGEWQGGKPVAVPERERRNAIIREVMAKIDAAGREFHPDYVLAGNLDFLGLAAVQVPLAAGVPVLHILGNQAPSYPPDQQPASPRYWIGAASDWNARSLAEAGYAPARVETVHPGARVDRFFKFFLPEANRLRICFAGLVLPFKGAHVLVDALERLHRAGVDFTAEIAGDAPDPVFLGRLQGAVRAAGLDGRVRFTGFLDRAGLAALFARSNVLVFPSQVPETFGISQVEAMASGLVVVTSGTGGAKEIVRHGVDGLVFPSGKADELAQQLHLLACDPTYLGRLQREAQGRAVGFDVQHSVRKVERLAEELLTVPDETAARSRAAVD